MFSLKWFTLYQLNFLIFFFYYPHLSLPHLKFINGRIHQTGALQNHVVINYTQQQASLYHSGNQIAWLLRAFVY